LRGQQIRRGNFDQCKVASEVTPNFADELTPILQPDGHLVGAIHHVVVRQNVAVAANDHARPTGDCSPRKARLHLERLAVAGTAPERRAIPRSSEREDQIAVAIVGALPELYGRLDVLAALDKHYRRPK